ncbi:MFS transporter [Candidatus Finniella inopinata]|uniref:MFS transporter n=1 Tax=Candidatus Finniella inopinata TaxID=1696036 RepID=A0A4Q7DJK6_9PROT|nr:MFS transporter [Candidatus Finniella inopinata]RZI46439.1 MFS transporter [Candidatus Finniella inopinata]
MSKQLARTVITSMTGNLFEWYDFALFGYFAPIIGKLFFPSFDPISQLLSAYGAFAAGYLARPLGGLFFGYIGDRHGRKKALVLTILFMAVPTALIGVLPTYEHIGGAAPVILILFRLLQGISMGGNYAGSITFTTEHSTKNRRGLVGSFTVTSCLLGLMLGSAMAALFSSILTDAQMEAWGWRLPFLAGISICVVGYYLRRSVAESPVYEQAEKTGNLSQTPVRDVFKKHGSSLLTLVLVVMLHDLSFYILFVYMTTHLTEFLHLSKSMAFTINTINMVFVSLITIGSAWLSDIYGRKIVMGTAAVLFIAGTIPLMMVVNQSDQMLYIFLAQALMAVGVGGYFGPLPALMVETFPTAVRNSAVSLTTNISGPLFGGTAPQIVIVFITLTGSNLVPAFYLTAGAVVALIALTRLKSVYTD